MDSFFFVRKEERGSGGGGVEEDIDPRGEERRRGGRGCWSLEANEGREGGLGFRESRPRKSLVVTSRLLFLADLHTLRSYLEKA